MSDPNHVEAEQPHANRSDADQPDINRPASGEVPWLRLHRLTVAVFVIYGVGVALAALIPTAIGLIRDGAGRWVWLAALGSLVIAAAVYGIGEVLWRLTHYRVTEERVEQRKGIVFRSFKSVPRDRVRTADITANPIYQILGLAKVTVGTGQKEASENLVLDAVGKDEAERLRLVLLRRTEAEPEPATENVAPVPRGYLLAELDWSWIRFAPLTSATFFLGLVPIGLVYQGFNIVGVELVGELIERRIWRFVESAVWATALFGALSVVVMGFISVCLVFIEGWWNFRLEREPDGTLRVRRGLLTTRSLSLEERRLRGIDLSEPFLVRLARAARLRAVATGLATAPGNPHAERSTLLPSVPRAEADRVAAAVLREDRSPTAEVKLIPHPKAALRRRLVWSLAPTVVGIVALAIVADLVSWLPDWLWAVGLVGLPIAIGFAVDAYRNLGHGLTERYLVMRYGTANRHTIALRRDGVIGVTVRQTIFQRRAGVATFGATTAAGDGVHLIRDAAADEGLAFVAEAFPDLVGPFSDFGARAGRKTHTGTDAPTEPASGAETRATEGA